MRRSARRDIPKFDIESALVELGADLVPSGFGWTRMRCPFHDDRQASASVNRDLQAFACMACGVKGDALKLLQTQLGLSFTEALARARALTGDSTGTTTGKPARKRRASDIFKAGGQ